MNMRNLHHYIQDYMGNNRMVVNRDGTIEQITHYYPYGGVIGDISTNENLQKFKFEGKELDRTFGLDSYDIEARQYFAMAPMWDRIDKKAEDYYGISPYAYCGGDPVNRGDYDGTDIWTIDQHGTISQEYNNEMDEFIFVNQGETVASVSYDYGTVKFESTGKDNVFIFGENKDAAIKVFEMAANNTDTEWGRVEAQPMEDDLPTINNIQTEMNPRSCNAANSFINRDKYVYKELVHSHPSGNPSPSGIFPEDTHGDVIAAFDLISKSPQSSSCYFAVYVPMNREFSGTIFHKESNGGYYSYTPFTTISSFTIQYKISPIRK